MYTISSRLFFPVSRPLNPTKGVFVSSAVIFHPTKGSAARHSHIQLLALALAPVLVLRGWGKPVTLLFTIVKATNPYSPATLPIRLHYTKFWQRFVMQAYPYWLSAITRISHQIDALKRPGIFRFDIPGVRRQIILSIDYPPSLHQHAPGRMGSSLNKANVRLALLRLNGGLFLFVDILKKTASTESKIAIMKMVPVSIPII
jgi:hypothetical protein